MSRPAKVSAQRFQSVLLLPAGKTCASCFYVERCVRLGFTTRENTTCDFAPIRFREAKS